MSRHLDLPRRKVNDVRSIHGMRMVFQPSYGQDITTTAPDNDGPQRLSCPYCDNPRHDGLESLSPHVRQEVIARLEGAGDPEGLLAAFEVYVSRHERRAA